MIYGWKCRKCGDETELVAPVSEYLTPPSFPCLCPGPAGWQRQIKSLNVDTSACRFPLDLSSVAGSPPGSLVANTRSEYKTICQERGWVPAAEVYSPDAKLSDGATAPWSVFSSRKEAPPDQLSADLKAQTTFMTREEVYGETHV